MNKLLAYGFWVIVVCYCACYVIYILYFAVDFPIQDDLLFILLIDDFERTGFSFSKIPYFLGELFRVDNDHCLMVPRVINLLNYAVAKTLNFKFQIALVAGMTVSLLILLLQQLKRLKQPLWIFLPVVFFLLQPQYYEVSLWALAGLEHVGVTLFLVSALISFQRNKIALGLLFASLGTFTSGNGIFIFAVVGFYLLLEKNYRNLIPLLFAFLGNVLLLFVVYKKGQQNNLAESLTHLSELLTYFLFLSGSIWEGLLAPKQISIIGGVLVLFLFGCLSIRKLSNNEYRVSSLFLAIVACNLITLALVALGRFSVGQMETASRYQYYSCVLFCSMYLVITSTKSSIWKSRFLFPILVLISFLFNVLSYFSTTETVAYNKASYVADTENWQAEENLFYIKPEFVNLVRPYFSATTERGIWKPNSEFNTTNLEDCLSSTTDKIRVFEQNFESDSTVKPSEINYVILEVKDLPVQPTLDEMWYVKLSHKSTQQAYLLPIRFLANGKANMVQGESYFRNFGYVKVFQGALQTGNYAVEFLLKSANTSCVSETNNVVEVLETTVFVK